jgi:hypothetical protein
MPGIPGAGGPPPKRAAERRRANKPEGIQVTQAPGADEVEIPEADPQWHPIAIRWFSSLAKSGQSRFYEPSDWETAYLIAESLSRDLKPQVVGTHPETGVPIRASIPLKGASLSSYLRAMGVLMVTEGDRRRARLELIRGHVDDTPSPGVTALDEYRNQLTG